MVKDNLCVLALIIALTTMTWVLTGCQSIQINTGEMHEKDDSDGVINVRP